MTTLRWPVFAWTAWRRWENKGLPVNLADRMEEIVSESSTESQKGSHSRTVRSTLLYSAAIAGLVLAASCSLAEEEGEIVEGECHGINACKAKGACAGKEHRCAGLNACKGQGWLKSTREDCDQKKGTFQRFSMEM